MINFIEYIQINIQTIKSLVFYLHLVLISPHTNYSLEKYCSIRNLRIFLGSSVISPFIYY